MGVTLLVLSVGMIPELWKARSQQAGGAAQRSAPMRLLLSQEAGTSARQERSTSASTSATEEFALCKAYVREMAVKLGALQRGAKVSL